jgi:hypothetical protein
MRGPCHMVLSLTCERVVGARHIISPLMSTISKEIRLLPSMVPVLMYLTEAHAREILAHLLL